MLDTHDASVSTHAPSFWHVNHRDSGPAQAWTPGHVHGPPLSGPGPQEGAGLLPLEGSPPLTLQPTPTHSKRASHAFPVVRMRVWPAHFTPAMKGAELLAALAAGHDRDVRLSGAHARQMVAPAFPLRVLRPDVAAPLARGHRLPYSYKPSYTFRKPPRLSSSLEK